ncbi:MAG: S16 family serine protease [Pseudomonadota bacterium]
MRLFGKSNKPDEGPSELDGLREQITAACLPEYVTEAALEELEKLSKTPPGMAEFTIGLNYIELLLTLPWNIRGEDNLDLKRAEELLDEEHFGLDRVKDRILEYLAVRTLRAKRKPRVLAADDEEITRDNLRHILEKEGWEVETAADGEEALAKLNRSEFDVVLTDMKMGRVDGLRVLDEARRLHPDCKVVILTGYATVNSAVETMKKGATDYLAKPFKLDDVRRTLGNIRDKMVKTRKARGPILCFVGPPGTGKTSLGRSIADALGRKFIRLSLAGLKDEAEIRGHRRTYAGAMPGRIIQEIKRAGVNNPVFLLDEVDKAIQTFKGDPTSALLEVLDPEQNHSFTDYYLDLPFDLSGVLFIATANLADPIPPALLDRMEVLRLTGYTDAEKADIALKFIIPRQISENGLWDCRPVFTREAVLKIIREYTREAGLRGLEREIAGLCRKLAREVLRCGVGNAPLEITPAAVETLLGSRRFYHEVAEAADRVGVTTGIFLTENGGEIVFVEATAMKGSSQLILTGSLGVVMQESAQAALSYFRSNAEKYHLDEDFFTDRDIHIHVPAGAVPKDGPSAGLTIAAALLSRLTGRPARRDVALTGELTLSGRVLPVGGLREKILAAHRGGVRIMVAPEKNRADFREIPPEAHEGLEVRFVDSVEKAAELALRPPRPAD